MAARKPSRILSAYRAATSFAEPLAARLLQRHGLDGAQIVQELTDRARVPIPQNVLYSLEEWCRKCSS